MKLSKALLLASFLSLIFLLQFPDCRAAIQCSDVVKDLTPCIKYLVNGSGAPPSDCCGGASKLAAATASNAADRRAACGCIQTAAKNIQPNAAAAKRLAGSCGISLPFVISPNIDCSKIN